MADGSLAQAVRERNEAARAKAYATPLDEFQVHDIEHFTSDTLWPWFERLRAEDPVHYTAESEYGPYWSMTSYTDIVAGDANHAVFSSCSSHGGITLFADGRDARLRGAGQLHRAGPAAARRPAQGGRADLLHPGARRAGAADPRAGRQDPRRAAASARVRLRRQGGDRADQPDAGDAVRLPVRAAAQAARFSDLLLRSPSLAARRRARSSARPRCSQILEPVHARCGTSGARRPAAATT